MKPLAFIYPRISENRTDDTEKTDYQAERGRAFAEAEGAEVHGVYTDDNVSGSKLLDRKQWNRMWEDAAEIAATGREVWVIARDVERLTRNKREAIDIMDKVEETGARIRTYDHGFDTARPEWEDDLMYRVMGGERYSRAISKNQKAKQEQLLKDGAWRGGPRPFGYYPEIGTKTRNGVERPAYDQTAVREEEAALIKAGTEAIIRGESLASVTRAWNESGVLTSMGNKWTTQTVKAVLTRYRNAGLIEHPKGSVYGDGAWPGIVSREDVAAVIEEFKRPTVRVPANGRGAPERVQARNTRKNGEEPHLLSGVLMCALCGSRMNQKTAGTSNTYTCVKPGCRKSVHYDVANERVTSYVVARLAAGDPAITRMGGDHLAKLTSLAHELAALREKSDKLQAAEESGLIDYDVFLSQSAKIKTRRDEIESERGRIRRANAIAGLIDGIRSVPVNLHGKVSRDRRLVGEKIAERFEELPHGTKVRVIRSLGFYEVHPNPAGVRATQETARHRIKITPLDPSTGEPYGEDEYATEG
jgi:DNA invertase Pin-like site-specific DNA recombinase